MADPNWLLSAVAQSTAALVAIVGGLLVSRLISLSSDRSALRRRRSSLEARLSEVSRDAENRRGELVAADVQDVIEPWTIALFEADHDLAIEELVEVAEAGGWLPADYAPHVAALKRTVEGAKVMTAWLDDLRVADLPGSLEELAQHAEVPEQPEDRYVWELVLDHYRERRVEQARQETPSFVTFPDLDLSSIVDPIDFTHPSTERKRDAYLEDLGEIRRLEFELDITTDAITDVEQPPGIWAGFAILASFAILGIVLPVYLMATLPEQPLTPATRWTVVAAFCVGLAALLAYIGWFILQLRQDET